MKLPLRERKKARTALAIEEAATELFESQGFEATTLEQIAEAAEIHKQTVLRYFKTKEDVAFARRNRLFEEFAEGLANRKGSVLDHWRNHIATTSAAATHGKRLRRHFEFLATDDRLYAYQLHLNQKHQDLLAAAFSEEAGVEPETDIFSRALAALLVSGNSDVARMTLRSGHDDMVPENIMKVIDLAASLRRDTITAAVYPKDRAKRTASASKQAAPKATQATAPAPRPPAQRRARARVSAGE